MASVDYWATQDGEFDTYTLISYYLHVVHSVHGLQAHLVIVHFHVYVYAQCCMGGWVAGMNVCVVYCLATQI